MDAVTYPNKKVIEFVQSRVVPVQLPSDAKPESLDYNVKWTPNLLIVDGEGKEHHRIIGFLPPTELIPAILLGVAKACFDGDRLDEAIQCFEQILSEYPVSGAAPEAVFFLGVALYKSTHVVSHLADAYQKLQVQYHYSEWARRAYPYWLLS